MDVILTLKAVQSLQGLVPEIRDDIVLFGEVLGEPVQITSPSPELLTKIDELLYNITHRQDTPQDAPSMPQNSEEYVDYQSAADYTLGGLGDD